MATNRDNTSEMLPGAFTVPSQSDTSQAVTGTLLPALKIKQEPVEAEAEPVITGSVQSSPGSWEHHRVRSYTRMKHVASPDTSVCEVCQGEFVHPTMLLLHKLCHFNTNHVCYVCDSYFIHTDTLILHMATIHRNLAVSSQNYKGETERAFVCSRCLQRFSSNKMLTKHQKLHTLRDDVSYGCKICALDFIGNRALTAHLNSPRHKEMKAKLQGIFICVDCRAIFPTRDSYAMHMMMRAQSETCDKITDDDEVAPSMTKTTVQQPNDPALHVRPPVTITTISDLMQAQETQLAICSAASSHSYSLAHTLQSQNMAPMYMTPSTFREQTGEAIVRNIINSLQAKHNAATTNRGGESSCSSMTEEPQDRDSSSPLNLSKPRSTELLSPRVINSQAIQMKRNVKEFMCKECGVSLDTQDAYAMHVMLHARGTPVTRASVTTTPSRTNGTCALQVTTGFRFELPLASPHTRPYSAPVNEAVKAGGQRSTLTPATCAVNLEQLNMQNENKPDLNGDIAAKSDETTLKTETMEATSSAQKCVSSQRKRSASADDAGSIKKSKTNAAVFSCADCQKQFADIDELTGHKRTCLPTVCSLCNLVFVDNFGLRVHQRCKSHQEQVQLKSLICHMCGWFASKPQEYVDHMKQHLPELDDIDQVIPTSKSIPVDDNISQMLVSQSDTTETNPVVSASNGITDITPTSRRSKRKPLSAAKCIPTSQSSDFDEVWSESSGGCDTPITGYLNDRPLSLSLTNNPSHHQHMGNTHTSSSYQPRQIPRSSISDTDRSTPVATSTRPTTTSGHLLDDADDVDVVDYILSNAQRLAMCKYCKIVYLDKTMYYLHMGLHNLNNPWQCNLCGKVCRDVHEFSSHVIHY